jgi:hypothetical protein
MNTPSTWFLVTPAARLGLALLVALLLLGLSMIALSEPASAGLGLAAAQSTSA